MSGWPVTQPRRNPGATTLLKLSIFTTKPDIAYYVPDGLHPGPAAHRIIIEKVLDAIVGHAPASVGRGYGEPTLADKAQELRKFPKYK